MENLHVILIHGNGGGKPTDNWFPYLKDELEKRGITVLAPQFPDSDLARESYWIPYLEKELKADHNTILIGHSSGAIAAMRFAEKHKIFGSILVGAYTTDLGVEKEKLSGYFDRPWDWEKIKNNQHWIVEFASTDDPWIPIKEARHIHEKLNTEYYEYNNLGHFGGDYNKETFPEIITVLKSKLQMKFTIEEIMDLTETWLTKGELNSAMLANNFQFISPFWKSNSRQEFIDKFQNSSAYQETSLSKITRFDPIIKLKSLDGSHFALILQYHTKNGSGVYEAVLGEFEEGRLTELRTIYDLQETKKALQIS